MPQIFVIQEYNATHHHYDLRLEIDVVLKSFAIPKTQPTKPGIKRLAIQTKDHPLEHADSDTKYNKTGAGTVTLRDRGGLVVEDLKENETILFELSGNKIQGRYSLIKTGFGDRRRRRTRTGCSLSENEGL